MPEVNRLIGKHLFPGVGSNIWFAEVLIQNQKDVALKILTAEADSFARDDSDVGCIRDLELNLDLEDQTPVQKNYVAGPKPLYPEVKAYIEDLLNRDFIRKSSSSYSSPFVSERRTKVCGYAWITEH